jgi:hypothetical protein
MKSKVLIGIALLVAAVIGLFLSFRHTPPAANNTSAAAHPGSQKPDVAGAVPDSNAARHSATPPINTKIISAPAKSQQPPGLIKAAWPDIQSITDGKEDFRKRRSAIARLPARLTDSDWEPLREFLLKKDSLDNEQLGQVLKNELMDALCAMNPPPVGLGEVLAQIYNDNGQNGVLRDYAVQHLATYAEQLEGSTDQAAIEERQKVRSTLWEALNETGDSIAGTALLGLKRLRDEGAQIDENRLKEKALEMANDNAAGELTHITAYQVCAQLNIQSALPLIEAAVKQSPTVSMQMSAIAALGLMGSSADIPLLENLLQGNEERLKPAAQHALEQIAARQNQPISPQIVSRK